MPKYLIAVSIIFFGHAAVADGWLELTDVQHPNCAQGSCVIRQGSAAFEIDLTVETKKDLDYLNRLTIKNRLNGAVQEFEVPAVNGSEAHEPFKVYRVNLQRKGIEDLALLAFNSAHAGPSYYYFLYDPRTKSFVQSQSTVPKLIYDRERRTLKTEVQGVPFKIENLQLKER